MQAEPLSRAIHDKALKLGITRISLHFSGGNDEGYLTVEFNGKYNQGFNDKIEDWAWTAYSYSGAGEGSDYGDDITYDLKKKTVTTSEWSMQRHDGRPESEKMELAK